ncbi:conserved hypothetical protein [Candidatus Caldarchaeum subterraneum]|uniref:Metallopeptidase domain-containing protein n=1 Tax=Caldiarchaeum subterraneum TaxID=311458 RepID=E6N8Q3_CALS0|nr:conserved hypothetical protein [Candidatus Caldarchaeum subterraneum]BAJ51377.1 conserved hypothetical protein [Candidatus Caldarchaeum subterraneum]
MFVANAYIGRSVEVSGKVTVLSYAEKLEKAQSFEDVYRLVKQLVLERYGLRRGGMGLILADLPPHIAAYHEIGSNAIVVNQAMLNAVYSATKSREMVNSYLFVVLLHEYLHALGFDEKQTRELVREAVSSALPYDHVATKIASTSIYDALPELRKIVIQPTLSKPVLIKDFDTDNLSYIG